MTVSSSTSDTRYSGNGSTTAFASGFTFYGAASLRVSIIVNATNVETVKTLTTHYTVTGGNGATGTITMLTAPATGETLVIKREEPYTQLTDLLEGDPLPANILESTYDKLAMQIQQVYRRTLTSIQAPASFNPNTTNPYTVPVPESGKYLVGNAGNTGWDSTSVATVANLPATIVAPQNRDLLEYDGGGAVWRNQTFATILNRLANANKGYILTAQGSAAFAFTGLASVSMGRLTLQPVEPVMIADYSAKTLMYFTPYIGNLVAVYDGTAFSFREFTELSNDTTQSSTGKAGPAAVVANKNYDYFVWDDGGVMRLTRGGAWNSDTVRSATDENDLQRIKGIPTNKNAITNGPAANRGTYVGTARSDGSSRLNWIRGGIAANGTAAVLGVWNMYNRIEQHGFIGDNTNSWAYSSATIRAANGSSTIRVSFICGLQEEYLEAIYVATMSTAAGSAQVGIGLNATNAFAANSEIGHCSGSGAGFGLMGSHRAQLLGWNFMSACEQDSSASGVTYYGDGAGGGNQTGLRYRGKF
jgi:hypothetical protein